MSLIAFLLISITLTAQTGKHGDLTITTPDTVIVNEYTSVTADIAQGVDVINVVSNTLNDSSRFAGDLEPGDLILIVQVQGADMIGFPHPDAATYPTYSRPNDNTWGQYKSSGGAGRYEYAEVAEIIGATQIRLTCNTFNPFTEVGNTVVVRVPRYKNLTVNAGSIISGDPWDGTVGGIVAIEVEEEAVVDGTIDASAIGFRGGQLDANNNSSGQWANNSPTQGAEKGESIYGYTDEYSSINGRYGRAAPCNGGGGGNGSEAGGGGGANIVADASLWNGGLGIPDPVYATAWALEGITFPINNLGGGRGGYSWADPSSAVDPLTVAPGDASWNGDDRRDKGGLGGRGINNSFSGWRLFMGGGGGAGDAGHAQMLYGGYGGRGGGILMMTCYGNLSGSGTISANGEDGDDADSGGVPLFLDDFVGDDGAGGAGGGGAIKLEIIGDVTGVAFVAQGGKGGDQVMEWLVDPLEAQGPGGGGGGGYICSNKTLPSASVSGGMGGQSNASFLTDFPYNGATGGSDGVYDPAVEFFYLEASSDTVCYDNGTALVGSSQGSLPFGVSYGWYDEPTGGTELMAGTFYPTGNLTETDTFYFGHCRQGIRRVPVVVTVLDTFATAGNDTTICSGASVTLHADTGTAFVWSPADGPTGGDGNDMVVSPVVDTRYFVTVTNNGCTDTSSVMVRISNTLTTTITGDTSVCDGASITLEATGGTNYTWAASASLSATNIATPTATPTAEEKYYVTITSGGGCEKVDSVTVGIWPVIDASVSLGQTICLGDSVVMQSNPSGSNGGPFTYTWSNSATTSAATVTPLIDSKYYVTVNDVSSSCQGIDSVEIAISPEMSLTLSDDTTLCNSAPIILNPIAAGGTGDLDYVWFDETLEISDTNHLEINPYSEGWYYVSVTDKANCTYRDSIELLALGGLTTQTNSDTSICLGMSVQLSVSGGVNYTWSDGSSVSDINSATPTVTVTNSHRFYVTVDDGAGCAALDSVDVNIAPAINLSFAQTGDPCPGDTAQITVTATGGLGPLQYAWDVTGSTSAIEVSPLVASDYTVTVTDSIGCFAQDTEQRVVTEVIGLVLEDSLTACQGQDANLTATVTGAGPYTYAWSDGVNGPSPDRTWTATADQILTLVVTDGTCFEADSIVLTAAATPNVVATGGGAVCEGGTIQLSASGATSYSWNGEGLTSASGADQLVAPTADGWYYVDGMIGANCTARDSAQVTIDSPFSLSIAGDTLDCDPATIDLTAVPTGASAPDYLWSTGEQTSTVALSPALDALTYAVVSVTDGACSSVDSVQIGVFSSPNLGITGGGNVCAGASTTLQATGATDYIWAGPDIADTPADQVTFTPTMDGWYMVTASFAGSCPVVDSVEVIVGTAVEVAIQGDTIQCAPNSVDLMAVIPDPSGFTYSWTNGASTSVVTINPTVDAAEYAGVTVTDGSCTGTDSVLIEVISAPTLTFGGGGTYCASADVQLTVAGATDYAWSGPDIPASSGSEVNFIATTSGWYVVTATVSGGCPVEDSVEVEIGAGLTLTLSGDTALCDGEGTTLTAQVAEPGSYTYSWDNNASTAAIDVQPTSNTSYAVTVSNGQCSSSLQQQVYVGASPVVEITGDVDLCSGEALSLLATVSGGSGVSDVAWALNNTPVGTGTTLFLPAASDGDEIIAGVLDANGCTDADTVDITVVPGITLTIDADDTELCPGDDFSAAASGADSYVWSGVPSYVDASLASVSGSVVTSGYAVVTGVSGNGCSAMDSVYVTLGGGMSLNLDAQPEQCEANDLEAAIEVTDGIGPYSYNWSTGQSTSAIALPGWSAPYLATVVVLDAIGCEQSEQVTVLASEAPVASLVSGDQLHCEGGSYTFLSNVTGGGPFTYQWSFNGTADTNDQATYVGVASNSGEICLVATNECGVASTPACAQLEVIPQPIADFSVDIPDCGTRVDLDNNSVNATSFEWSTYAALTTDTGTYSFDFGAPGTYLVWMKAKGINGLCADSTAQEVVLAAGPHASFEADPLRSSIDEAQFEFTDLSTGSITDWTWEVADSSFSLEQSPELYYKVLGAHDITLTVDDGTCQDDTTITIVVFDPDVDENGVRIPNTITPNGDGKNDTWTISNIEGFPNHKVQIFNRNGHIVYESTNYAGDWAGEWQAKSIDAPATTYYYVVELTSNDVLKGTLTVVRAE